MTYKLFSRVIQYFCFPDRPMKGGNLKKGGVDLEMGGI